MSPPVVEIITPTAGQARFQQLWLCHSKVLAQSYQNIIHTIVVDGQLDKQLIFPTANYHWLEGPHDDHGSAALNYGVDHHKGDFLMQLADDEYLEPLATEKLVDLLTNNPYDFVNGWREFYSMSAYVSVLKADVEMTITTGLFLPKCWDIANMICGPSGVYSQPGADGRQAWDWIQNGARWGVVPEVVSRNQLEPTYLGVPDAC